MKGVLAKSYRLKRYHMVLVIIVIGAIIWLMLRYFAMIEASFERLSFEHNLRLIERLIHIQNIIAQEKDICRNLRSPDFFIETVGGMGLNPAAEKGKRSVIKKWRYLPKKQVLTYYVQSRDYFHGRKQEIQIAFICWNNKVYYKVSRHQWCADMRLWGCREWESVPQ
ncbi:hypothetical protein [Legionella londiniensis]|uniref:Uncharacterized protein n=1 Tax=Legionella londiniensis TaxID=45068 RepID=A0A0W0VIM8_9GAMM|nr:hypothetical protein [Legionella londiniensis]KTD19899.1 hypothetical protein Llon_2071 [Legionella londiniensis]STX94229.1 Uncharacterised protein [Legionella londiniensis]